MTTSYTSPQWFAAAGWLCPRCKIINAPSTPYCYRCAPAGTQVAKDTTDTNPREHMPTTTSGAKP